MASRQLLTILGVMAAFLVLSGASYYASWISVWNSAGATKPIGAEPLHIKVVSVVKPIAAGAEIDFNNVDERYVTQEHVSYDSFGFVSECIGRRAKWALPGGSYVSRHDVLPQGTEVK